MRMRRRERRHAHVLAAVFVICCGLGQAPAQELELDTTCLLEPDSLDLCPGVASLCNADGQVGETIRNACGTTCGVCKASTRIKAHHMLCFAKVLGAAHRVSSCLVSSSLAISYASASTMSTTSSCTIITYDRLQQLCASCNQFASAWHCQSGAFLLRMS